jgi:choline dehydrogenase
MMKLTTSFGESYDYIVVGSGSAGAVIAARLSENHHISVLCLEAGERGSDFIWTRPPAGTHFLYDNPAVNWCYHSEPDPTHGNRKLYVPRGKIIGGSSSINGMVYNRGQKVDYDTWASLGCAGWSYDEVLPFFKKMESTKLGTDVFRGRHGPLQVEEAPKLTPFYDLFIDAAKASGLPYNDDYSGATQEGVAMAQHNAYGGWRQSSATQYLDPARRRKNLCVLSGAEVTSLRLEGTRCVGVVYRDVSGTEHQITANKEVIVCAGAANSPKLLELSGIGNPEILQGLGIEVKHALRGVGENLRDHYAAVMKWEFNEKGLSLSSKGRGLGLAREVLRWSLFRTGFISQVFGSMRVFMRSEQDEPVPDIMMIAIPFVIQIEFGKGRRISPIQGFFMNAHVQRTESVGSVHARSSDPSAAPLIRYRFLDTERDRSRTVSAVRRTREIVSTRPLSSKIKCELQPGPAVQTDDEILDFVRRSGQTTNHMVGTCKMGTDVLSVVDPKLRVRGLQGLRVADGSIMPTIVSGNTNIPCMMIGEKCAALILEDLKN